MPVCPDKFREMGTCFLAGFLRASLLDGGSCSLHETDRGGGGLLEQMATPWVMANSSSILAHTSEARGLKSRCQRGQALGRLSGGTLPASSAFGWTRASLGLWLHLSHPCLHLHKSSLSVYQSVQSLSRVRLLATPRTAARQTSLSFTNSWSFLKLTSIESAMPSNRLILCCPLLLLPSIFPSIRIFSNESALCTR